VRNAIQQFNYALGKYREAMTQFCDFIKREKPPGK